LRDPLLLPAMLSVVIPTLNAETHLMRSLPPLASLEAAGLVREVVISDGGSEDHTAEVADAVGARFVQAPRGRAVQLRAGAAAARGSWLLFLHADTALQPGWAGEVRAFMAASAGADRAAAFRFACDDSRASAQAMARWVDRRCRWLKLPYGDQGLLMPRGLYDALGGYREMPFLEDVDFVRRIGRRRMAMLRSEAETSAEKYRRDGFRRRALRNLALVGLYFAGVSPHRLSRLYD